MSTPTGWFKNHKPESIMFVIGILFLIVGAVLI
ncbi:hypothetical protein ANRL1_01089 [Anaerolineae bacterium]|nr:hypothetical protein ANRL1_01089 [Anaerolineae bacterium]